MTGRRFPDRRSVRVLALCIVVAIATVGAGAGPVGAQSSANDEIDSTFVVDVDESGDADLRLVMEFDLTTESEQEAFEELQSDETRQQELLDEYETRMDRIATRANSEVDREMAVSDPRSSVETNDDGTRGVITLAVRWSALAATDGDELTIEEPFASGYQSDGSFTVVPPEGYGMDSATPEPDAVDGTVLHWDAGSDLSAFSVVLTPDASGTTDDTDASTGPDASSNPDSDSQPGFGLVAAMMAFGLLAIYTARRE